MSESGPGKEKAPAGNEARDTVRPDDRPAPRQREVGGRLGPDPTRYGDWEKAGRCIDF